MTDFDKKAFKKAIGMVESSGGKYLSNKSSSAAGRYHFLYNNIKHIPSLKGVSKLEFINSPKLQEDIMDKALNGTLPGYPNYQKYAKELKNQFKSDLPEEELAALTHFLGKGGAKQYLNGSEKFKVPGKNASVDQYLTKFRNHYTSANPESNSLFPASSVPDNSKDLIDVNTDKKLDNTRVDSGFKITKPTYEAAEGATNDSIDFMQQLKMGGYTYAEGGEPIEPTKPEGAASIIPNENIATSKSFVKNWMAHPETRKRYRANISGEPTTSKTNLGVDNNTFKEALTNIDKTTTNVKKPIEGWGGEYSNSNIDFYGQPSKGTAAHEYTHAAGKVSNNLSDYLMDDYGPLSSVREKTGLNTSDSIKKAFNTNGNFATEAKIKQASYMGQNGELYPRIMEMRQLLNVKPGQQIDDKMIQTLMNDKKTGQTAKFYTPEKLKKMLNTVADNSQPQLNNIAAMGGDMGNSRSGAAELIPFEEGGTHEQNAYGGIPIGNGNSVEEGETMVKLGGKDYVFSDRIGMYPRDKKNLTVSKK